MQFRKFGNTSLLVSEIGFGAWAIGGAASVGTIPIGWGDADDEVSKKAIYRALENGINFFDTADIYGLGHSETLLGETVGNNDKVIIATKAGNVGRNGQLTGDYSKQYILQACEASLKRLKREVIDYYQLHTARLAHLQQGECIEAMQLLQQQGKIRYWGLSLNTFEPDAEANYLIDRQLGSGFQLVFNIINRRALHLMKRAADAGYGIIVRMALQFGLLTGKFDAGVTFADTDHRKNRLPKEVIDTSAAALQPVWTLCQKYGLTKTQLALSYILSYPQVSTIIPGIRTPEQADSNTQGLVQFSEEDKLFIEKTEVEPLMQMIQQQG